MKVRPKTGYRYLGLLGAAEEHENGTIIIRWSDGYISQFSKQMAKEVLVFIVPAPSRKTYDPHLSDCFD